MNYFEEPTQSWRYTNNPEDPCAYCISWEANLSDRYEEYRPYYPDGSPVTLIYTGVHDACDTYITGAFDTRKVV